VLATVTLLDDERSRPGGVWSDAVAAWNGDRIRKIVRRGRASAWLKAQEPDGVTVERDGAEVRAYVPGPLDRTPRGLAKLQIQSTDLEEVRRVDSVPQFSGLVIAVTPFFEMSWGKQAAQCAHAGQWAWMRSDKETVDGWDAAGRPIEVVHPTAELWNELHRRSVVQIHDGGFTEIPAGTNTAIALWQV
jgi:peptidyl-tRNA hydrolase